MHIFIVTHVKTRIYAEVNKHGLVEWFEGSEMGQKQSTEKWQKYTHSGVILKIEGFLLKMGILR